MNIDCNSINDQELFKTCYPHCSKYNYNVYVYEDRDMQDFNSKYDIFGGIDFDDSKGCFAEIHWQSLELEIDNMNYCDFINNLYYQFYNELRTGLKQYTFNFIQNNDDFKDWSFRQQLDLANNFVDYLIIINEDWHPPFKKDFNGLAILATFCDDEEDDPYRPPIVVYAEENIIHENLMTAYEQLKYRMGIIDIQTLPAQEIYVHTSEFGYFMNNLTICDALKGQQTGKIIANVNNDDFDFHFEYSQCELEQLNLPIFIVKRNFSTHIDNQ